MMPPFVTSREGIIHARTMLDSYRRWLGRDLIDRSGDDSVDAMRLFEAPAIALSHTPAADPILNYGNRAALALWETDWERLTTTPSRLTAEPIHRDERARLLERTSRDGYVDDYQGVRISTTGQRFQIERAIVWNLIDAQGAFCGQAATFTDWKPLDARLTDPTRSSAH